MNVNALKAAIVAAGYKNKDVAENLNMSISTFLRKMKRGNFGLDDVNIMIPMLGIKNPTEIFFDKK
jgi:hypothetical protein